MVTGVVSRQVPLWSLGLSVGRFHCGHWGCQYAGSSVVTGVVSRQVPLWSLVLSVGKFLCGHWGCQ